MTLRAKQRPNEESDNSSETKHESTSLISPQKLFQILKRGKAVRSKFVESHLDKGIAYQIRSLRHGGKWTQLEFAAKLGIKHPNNVSARLENPYYGKMTLSTLKQIAAACDVALIVWFIPFSRFIKWVTGTPYLDSGLSEDFYNIPTFGDEFEMACVPAERMPPQSARIGEFDSAFEYSQGRMEPNPAQRAAEIA
jgi:transcriptional regulator with XRE-family HTH domain